MKHQSHEANEPCSHIDDLYPPLQGATLKILFKSKLLCSVSSLVHYVVK